MYPDGINKVKQENEKNEKEDFVKFPIFAGKEDIKKQDSETDDTYFVNQFKADDIIKNNAPNV